MLRYWFQDARSSPRARLAQAHRRFKRSAILSFFAASESQVDGYPLYESHGMGILNCDLRRRVRAMLTRPFCSFILRPNGQKRSNSNPSKTRGFIRQRTNPSSKSCIRSSSSAGLSVIIWRPTRLTASARMLASMQASKETSPGDSAGDRRNGPETRRGCLFHQIEVNESGCQPQGCFGIFYNQKVVIVV